MLRADRVVAYEIQVHFPEIMITSPVRFSRCLAVLTLALGCAAATSIPSLHAQNSSAAAQTASVPLILREGDELQITFPGAPTLNTQQRIRSDGRITLDLVGEVIAVGLTPLQFQERLIQLYAPQLVSKEVTVRLISRQFFVYVNGSVDRHGRLDFDRPVSLLEAVMAAGFADGTVNLSKVKLMRAEAGKVRTTIVDLNRLMEGKDEDIPELKQGDMIVVPGRIL